MFTNGTKNITKPKYLNSHMEPSAYKTIESIRQMDYVDDITAQPIEEYESLWSCVFTLDTIKRVNREIWMVQDKEEKRRSTVMLHERNNQI